MLDKAIKDFISGLKLYHVWVYQAYHDISAKYKRTFLGSLWISGQTVATSIALSLIFGGIFGSTLRETLPYIMGGIICFGLCSFMLTDAVEIFIRSAGIIRNHANPFSYYILEAVARNFFLFLHNIVVYYLLMLAIGALKVPDLLIIPGIIINLVNMLAWGTVGAMVASRFRDMRYLLPYISHIMYFMTPIFWHIGQLHGPRSHYAQFNPFYGLLEIIRSPMLGLQPPEHCWSLAIGTMATGVVMWALFFSLFRRRIPFWL